MIPMGVPLRRTVRGPGIPCPIARRRKNNAERLRRSVYAMPRKTVEAMLRGVRSNRIIVGGYVDKRGGVCPMLAAHRNGGRTNFGTFARAWDAFTGAGKRPRRAARRDVRTLEGYLEMALTRDPVEPNDDPDGSLAEEVRKVKASRRRLAEAEAQEDADRPVVDVLAATYAAAEERRAQAEDEAGVLIDTDDLDEMDEAELYELDSAEAWAEALEQADADRT
jgi:hypothetical protein